MQGQLASGLPYSHRSPPRAGHLAKLPGPAHLLVLLPQLGVGGLPVAVGFTRLFDALADGRQGYQIIDCISKMSDYIIYFYEGSSISSV